MPSNPTSTSTSTSNHQCDCPRHEKVRDFWQWYQQFRAIACARFDISHYDFDKIIQNIGFAEPTPKSSYYGIRLTMNKIEREVIDSIRTNQK